MIRRHCNSFQDHRSWMMTIATNADFTNDNIVYRNVWNRLHPSRVASSYLHTSNDHFRPSYLLPDPLATLAPQHCTWLKKTKYCSAVTDLQKNESHITLDKFGLL